MFIILQNFVVKALKKSGKIKKLKSITYNQGEQNHKRKQNQTHIFEGAQKYPAECVRTRDGSPKFGPELLASKPSDSLVIL
ncbi:hypothetical protein WA026_010794 [Henosepilachna vigintioctopunctata]|uniref:Uncharacterized protein n=1 Tax=Henosepilachna vigintioctopunctata TaxID=420089 RepID=A0AAW1UW15_9CUCU